MFYTSQIKQQDIKTMISDDISRSTSLCHGLGREVGWWDGVDLNDPQTIATKLCLIHSEVSEAMEGVRKDLMDDHLPHRA